MRSAPAALHLGGDGRNVAAAAVARDGGVRLGRQAEAVG